MGLNQNDVDYFVEYVLDMASTKELRQIVARGMEEIKRRKEEDKEEWILVSRKTKTIITADEGEPITFKNVSDATRFALKHADWGDWVPVNVT